MGDPKSTYVNIDKLVTNKQSKSQQSWLDNFKNTPLTVSPDYDYCKYRLPCGWCELRKCDCTAHQQPDYTPRLNVPECDHIPYPCKQCPTHPSNGGTGVCNCTLGIPEITC